MKSNAVYFGGSRHQQNINPSQIAAVVAAVVASGQAVNVGCQYGADQAVIKSAALLPRPYNAPSQFLRVFAVAPTLAESPAHIQWVNTRNVSITFAAGGHTAPMHARFLLRSIAAFQGCNTAVFFNPGAGSLAVAREAVKARLSIFAFSQTVPKNIPSTFGNWVSSEFFGFACYGFYYPEQPQLF